MVLTACAERVQPCGQRTCFVRVSPFNLCEGQLRPILVLDIVSQMGPVPRAASHVAGLGFHPSFL